jgi:Na+/H+ antiporter NhaD/arsenite permease-like protein
MRTALALLLTVGAAPALAAEPASGLNGAALSPLWIVPFAGILLSIALMPVTAPGFWHHHFGKTTAFWAFALVIPLALNYGLGVAAREVVHTLLAEYLPFMLLLFALFTVSGGVHVRGNLHGSAWQNTRLLGLGTLLASVMGTTGAAMVLIRPLLRANDSRRHRAHVVVFFIFLVANIGGALTPLGDPPLFLGFLKGVDFFWTTKAMLWPTLTAAALLLAMFFVIDRWLWTREDERRPEASDPTPDAPLAIQGRINIVLLGAIVALVLMSGVWKPDLEIVVYGWPVELQNLTRDAGLLAIAWASWRLTPRRIRQANHFTFGPIIEVAKLFAGIFITITPAIAMLRAGSDGVMAPVIAALADAGGKPNDVIYFWMTGALSSFLDNAPTYLVFFNLAGGDASVLMGPLGTTLVAISAGAVFMGANTYIGNAPNLMVKSIAESRGVRMPSFFGYLGWSLLVLVPVYVLLTLLYFM